jgi:hypothetical protein
MYRIMYASRLVTDARETDDPSNIIRSQQVKQSYARYDSLDDAVRQAINDLYFGKVVLGIDEEESGKIVLSVEELTATLAKAESSIEKEVKRGFSARAARRVVLRELKL